MKEICLPISTYKMFTLIAGDSVMFFIIVAFAFILQTLIKNAQCLTFVEKEGYNLDLQVKTNNGIVQGFSRKMGNNRDMFVYRGIPFATPPLYNLRFTSPQPQANWSGVLDGRQQAPSCVELLVRAAELTVKGSEDCLYLNVYSPIVSSLLLTKIIPKPGDRELVPVMFWIHGGAFIEGNATRFDPEYFIEEDVVVVTANYRLGMFGFLSTQDDAIPGNYGLKDQNAVLLWIRENIANFGGDPDKVTIMGESAGACSVMYHMVSPKSRGLFHGAIAMSGDSLTPWCFQRQPRNVASDISVHLGLSMKNTTAFVETLKMMDSGSLIYGQIIPIFVNFLQVFHNGLPFTPVIESNHKDAFLTESSYALLETGRFAKVPLIMGTTSTEANLFGNILLLVKPLLLIFDISPSLIPVRMNFPSLYQRRIVGNKIKMQYFRSKSMISATNEEWFQYFTDIFYVKSVYKSVELIGKHVPVYMYLFDYEGPAGLEYMKLYNYIGRKVKGAGHAEDLVYLWKKFNYDQKDKLVSRRFVKMWANFIKYSNPTPVIEGLLQNVTWPPVTASQSVNYLRIGDNLTVLDGYRRNFINFWNNLYEKYCKKPFYTY